MLRLTLIAVITGAVVLVLACRPAYADTVSCGDTITADTTLRRDLTNCTGNGLIVGADHIRLNLNGHTVDGDATPATAGFDDGIAISGHHGVTIERGTVQEFDHAVALDGASGNRLRGLTTIRNSDRAINLINGSNANRIERNTSSDNGGSGLRLISSNDNVVEHNILSRNVVAGMGGFTAHRTLFRSNVVIDNGDNGSFWSADSTENRIEANLISGNPGFGITIDGGDHNLVRGNHVVRAGLGILVSGQDNAIVANRIADTVACPDFACGTGIADEGGTRNLIAFNRVSRTVQEGIRVNAYEPDTPPAIGIVIRANTVRRAGTDGIGIATDPGGAGTVKDTVVAANLVTRSGHDGIRVAQVPTVLTRNLTLRNQNLGIEAIAGVTDGGGNHAFGNGNPLQCLNVGC